MLVFNYRNFVKIAEPAIDAEIPRGVWYRKDGAAIVSCGYCGKTSQAAGVSPYGEIDALPCGDGAIPARLLDWDGQAVPAA